MNYTVLFLGLLIISCSANNNRQQDAATPAATISTNDTIPLIRKEIAKAPVAAYLIPINNPLLKQYFGVKVFETKYTFHFLLKMQYEGVAETDTLKIPNFGTWPVVQVNKGPEKMSCIIGFLDKYKHFREYKMLSAKGDQLKLTILKRYGVGTYSTAN